MIATIIRRLSMIIIVYVSQSFLRAKTNHDIAACCSVDCERVSGFLVWEYLALVDEVIITNTSCANYPC
jgi:hypothetical protein